MVIVLLPKPPTIQNVAMVGPDLRPSPLSLLSLAHGPEAPEQELVLGTCSVGVGSYSGHWEGEQLGTEQQAWRVELKG